MRHHAPLPPSSSSASLSSFCTLLSTVEHMMEEYHTVIHHAAHMEINFSPIYGLLDTLMIAVDGLSAKDYTIIAARLDRLTHSMMGWLTHCHAHHAMIKHQLEQLTCHQQAISAYRRVAPYEKRIHDHEARRANQLDSLALGTQDNNHHL